MNKILAEPEAEPPSISLSSLEAQETAFNLKFAGNLWRVEKCSSAGNLTLISLKTLGSSPENLDSTAWLLVKTLGERLDVIEKHTFALRNAYFMLISTGEGYY